MNKKYKFTVFTATYNRGNILHKLYESLKKQNFGDFEWLIVDDGSTDNTEKIVSNWIDEKVINIKYFKQKNSGKHVAINFGVTHSDGELFLIIDSDDQCISNALEIFNNNWNSIDIKDRNNFYGIYSNCMDKNNQIIGNKFPEDVFDSNFVDLYYKYNIYGDKWGFIVTDILKQYPFPVIKNENFLTEAIIWNRISLKFKARFINEPLLIVEYREDGLSKNSLLLRIRNPIGSTLYYKEFLELPVSFFWKSRNIINYIRFSFHANIKIIKQINIINRKYIHLYLFFLFPGYIFYIIDKIKI